MAKLGFDLVSVFATYDAPPADVAHLLLNDKLGAGSPRMINQ